MTIGITFVSWEIEKSRKEKGRLSAVRNHSLQHEELFSTILCFEGAETFSYRCISKYVRWVHLKHAQFALGQFFIVLKDILFE